MLTPAGMPVVNNEFALPTVMHRTSRALSQSATKRLSPARSYTRPANGSPLRSNAKSRAGQSAQKSVRFFDEASPAREAAYAHRSTRGGSPLRRSPSGSPYRRTVTHVVNGGSPLRASRSPTRGQIMVQDQSRLSASKVPIHEKENYRSPIPVRIFHGPENVSAIEMSNKYRRMIDL